MHLRYLKYVLRHKWFVLVAGVRIGAPLWRLLVHDLSKLRRSEWGAFAGYWFGDREQYRLQFDRAWLLHLHRNAHHWQHWVLVSSDGVMKAIEMPKDIALEMVADWMGAGRAINGRWEAEEWYLRTRDRRVLHSRTREFVERILRRGNTVEDD